MTNKEWLLKEMEKMSDEELMRKIVGIDCLCDEQRSKCKGRICEECRLEWFKQEHKEKIKLSEAEKVILENIDTKYSWIARDKDGTLCVYDVKPKKDIRIYDWVNGEYLFNLSVFSHLFQFIKWENEEPYNIQELLENSK